VSNGNLPFNGWNRIASLLIGLLLGVISGAAGGFISTWVNATRIIANKEDIRDNEQKIDKLSDDMRKIIREEIERHERVYHGHWP